MRDKILEILILASRQYCHNSGEGLLKGYDEKETEKIVGGLLDENKKLRHLLWLNHNKCEGLYGDDGEMQCNECRIDFLRDSADEIELKIIKKKNPEYYKMLTSDQAMKEESQ